MTASKRSWLARHCRSQASPPLLFGGRGVRPFPFSVPPRREWSAGRRQEVCETSFGGALRSAPPGRLARPPAPVGVGAAPPGAPPGLAGAYVACRPRLSDQAAPHECGGLTGEATPVYSPIGILSRGFRELRDFKFVR